MKSLLAIISFCLVLSGGFRTAFADVSKDEVKKLITAGLADDVILKYVAQHGPMAKLSSEDLAELKTAGASDSLLSALVTSESQSPTPPSTYPSPGDTYVYSYDYPYYYPYYSPYYPYYYSYPPFFFSFRTPLHHRFSHFQHFQNFQNFHHFAPQQHGFIRHSR